MTRSFVLFSEALKAPLAFWFLLAGWVFAAGLSSGEEIGSLAELARALRKQASSDVPSRQPTIAVPKADPAQAADLLAISRDPKRSRFQRCAALVMLSQFSPLERRKEIEQHFAEICRQIAPFHVHPAERYANALVGPKDGNAQARRPPVQGRARVPWPTGGTGKTRLTFAPEDTPILAQMALAPREGECRNRFPQLSLVALGLANDARSLDVLLICPDRVLGDSGVVRDPAFHGLRLLCEAAEHRNALAEWLVRKTVPSVRGTRATLVLAHHKDERAIEPLVEVLRGLRPPEEIRARAVRERGVGQAPRASLPRGVNVKYVLSLCARWKDPRLGPGLLAYIDAGGPALKTALSAAAACGAQPEKEQLWALLHVPRDYWDVAPLLKALNPLVKADDAERIVSLLTPDQWETKNFYLRVLWVRELDEELHTPRLRDSVLAIAERHPKGSVRDWAVDAIGRFDDGVCVRALQGYANNGSATALRHLVRRAENPWQKFVQAFDNRKPELRKAASEMLRVAFSSHPKMPLDLSGAQKAELVRLLLPHLRSEPPTQCVETLHTLYVLVVRSPLNTPAERSPALDSAILEALAPFCRRDTDKGTAWKAACCLRAMGGEAARELLTKMAEENPHEEVRRFAAREAARLER